MEKEKLARISRIFLWAFRILFLFSLLLIFKCYEKTLNPQLGDLSGDSARFLMLAKSLAQGTGYSEIEKPGNPPHSEYMPGLPLLLAPLYYLWPGNLKPMKWLMVMFAFSALVFFYLYLFRESKAARFVLVLTYALIPLVVESQFRILADIPHLALLLLAFFYFERTRDKPEPKIWSWVLAGLLAALAFYFRQLAIFIFASGIIAMLLSKNLRKLKSLVAYALGFLAPASIWYIRNFALQGAIEPSYGKKLWYAQASNPFAGTLTTPKLIARIFRRIDFFSLHLGKNILIDPFWQMNGTFKTAIWILFLALLLFGLGYELLKRKNIASIFFFPYLVAVSSWEGWVPRYLLPLLPLALFFIYRGLELTIGFLIRNRRYGKLISAELFIIWFVSMLPIWIGIKPFPLSVCAVGCPSTQYPCRDSNGEWEKEKESVGLINTMDFRYFPESWDWEQKGETYYKAKCTAYYHFFAMAEWTWRNLGPDAVVVCRKPTLFAWQSQGKSVQYPAELEVDKFLEGVKKRGGNHLLIEEISPELRPVLFQFWKSRPERLKLEKQIGETYLLKLE